MYTRKLDLTSLIKHKSLFLLGSRQTGKSTLLRTLFPQAKWFDLLEADTFRELSARPEWIRQTLKASDELIIIDEIQKLPKLLDEVQLLIDRYPHLRFILTGSSARKLKRGGANLLGGRAWIYHLHPLISSELNFLRLNDRLTRGSLPAIIDSSFYEQDLRAYVGTYLQEEIQAEGFARSIESFSRFLELAGLSNGEQLNFTAIASDTGIPAKTIREYYQILEDTLVGHLLPAYQKTIKRKAMATAKFYFFDVGIANVLMRRGVVSEGSESFGRALEHLILLELRAYLDYNQRDIPLTYWRSRSGYEVDFIVGDLIAIEVKSAKRIRTQDCKGLLALNEEISFQKKIIIANEMQRVTLENGIEVWPINAFCEALWAGEII